MRLTALATGLYLALTGLVAAQPFETPEALIEAFYEPYFSGEFPEDESQFRSAALQDLYDADAALTPDGEMGALSFDPYVDGQDFELSELDIQAAEIAGEHALVEVSFTNFGEPRALTYELVFENNGWKIDDVVSRSPDNSYRLSEIFAEATASF